MMRVTIGLDIGGSTTKVVGFDGKKCLEMAKVTASDPIASAYGGVGRFMSQNGLIVSDIREIIMTGVGSGAINTDVLQIPTRKADEFEAVGLGGLYLAKTDRCIVVSMGTGTSIISADSKGGRHVIGSGVGGGTLLGLSQAMLHISDVEVISSLASQGDLSKVDLTIGDISRDEIPGLPAYVTASNFGKLDEEASREDLAKGIVNLVFQSVGTAAMLSARLEGLEQVVFVGYLPKIKEGQEVLHYFSQLYGTEVIIPENAEFATAMGAALTALTDENSRW